MPNSQRGFAPIFLVLIVIIIFFLSGITFYFFSHRAQNNSPEKITITNPCPDNPNIEIGDKSCDIEVTPTIGTSMLPTIHDGQIVNLSKPYNNKLERGDLISFSNSMTRGKRYLKRIIGIPNEKVVIKNGLVIINGKALDENYTLKNQSTYGSTKLIECEEYTIPSGQYLVLGDNRTGSSDSRMIGFVDRNDIDGVIKTNLTDNYLDSQTQYKITNQNIDPTALIIKLNEVRSAKNLSPLKTHPVLNQMATEMSGKIRDNFNDWEKQNFSEIVFKNKKYHFNHISEYDTFGYNSEQDVIDQIFDTQYLDSSYLSNEYSEIGIGISEGKNKECTFPIVSVILSEPKIPTYDQTDLDIWAKYSKLDQESIDNLQTWKGNPEIDQTKLEKYIQILKQMQPISQDIYHKEMSGQKLTWDDLDAKDHYFDLLYQSVDLDNELFAKYKNTQGVSTRKLPLERSH
jgi:signal peptidase I